MRLLGDAGGGRAHRPAGTGRARGGRAVLEGARRRRGAARSPRRRRAHVPLARAKRRRDRRRYEAERWAAPEQLPGAATAFAIAPDADEVVLWLPGPRALVVGDVLLGAADGGLRLCPPRGFRRASRGRAPSRHCSRCSSSRSSGSSPRTRSRCSRTHAKRSRKHSRRAPRHHVAHRSRGARALRIADAAVSARRATSSSSFGSGVSRTSSAIASGHAQPSFASSRATPGCSCTRASSLVSGWARAPRGR